MNTTLQVLLVEDNEGDVELTEEALRDANFPVELMAAGNGLEALDILFKRGEHADTVTPHLILLDLNMPQMDGREVLQIIKQDDALKRIPVVVLTSSEAEADILRSYDLHANAFVTKPVDLDKFVSVIQNLGEFWFDTVQLPSK